MRRTKKPSKSDPVEFTLQELFCLLSAFSGCSLEEVKRWKVPYFMKMYKVYIKDVKVRRTEL